MALALTRRAMKEVPGSGGMSHTKTRPDEAGAALSPMKGGSILILGTDGILPSDRSSAIRSSRQAFARRDTGSILRRCADDGYRRNLKNACLFLTSAPPMRKGSCAGIALGAWSHAVFAHVPRRCRRGRLRRGLGDGHATARQVAQACAIGGSVVSLSRFSLHRSSPAFVPPERPA
jgi:hypothetical protein